MVDPPVWDDPARSWDDPVWDPSSWDDTVGGTPLPGMIRLGTPRPGMIRLVHPPSWDDPAGTPPGRIPLGSPPAESMWLGLQLSATECVVKGTPPPSLQAPQSDIKNNTFSILPQNVPESPSIMYAGTPNDKHCILYYSHCYFILYFILYLALIYVIFNLRYFVHYFIL